MRFFILGVAICCNAGANILIKVGMNRIGKVEGLLPLIRKAAVEPAFIGGIVMFAMALGGYSFVLTKMNLSIAYPIMISMGLIIVIAASRFLLNEHVSMLQIVGFILIIGGVWLVAR